MYVCLDETYYTLNVLLLCGGTGRNRIQELQCVCFFEQLIFLNLVWHSILFFVADGKEIIHFSVIPPVLYCAMLCVNSFQA